MPRHKTTSVFLITIILASLSTVAPFSIDTYLPSFPSIAYELNASALQMQQSMSLYMIGFAVMTLFAGSLSDALGRRNITMVALLVYAAASLGCSYATDINTFLWLRFLQGVAASVGMVVGRAVVRDMYSGDDAQRMMSNVLLFFAMAPALAPIIGGMLEVSYGWRAIFIFLMFFGLAIMLLVYFKLPETLPKEQRHSMHPVILLKNYRHAITHMRFTAVAFVITLSFSGFFVYITASPRILFSHLGFEPNQFYLMFVPVVIGVMTGSFASGRLSGKVSPFTLINAGFVIMAVACFLNLLQAYLLPPIPAFIIAPVVLYGAGVSISLPALTVLGLDQLPGHRGLASSLQSFIHMGINGVVAGVVTPLVFNRISYLSYTMTAFLLASFLLYMMVHTGLKATKSLDPSVTARDNH